MTEEKARQFVVVVSPAFVKPIHDGKKKVVVYPGAPAEQIAMLTQKVDKLRGAPHLSMLTIKPEDLDVEFVDVKDILEIRGG
jgi:hypothetical protein